MIPTEPIGSIPRPQALVQATLAGARRTLPEPCCHEAGARAGSAPGAVLEGSG